MTSPVCKYNALINWAVRGLCIIAIYHVFIALDVDYSIYHSIYFIFTTSFGNISPADWELIYKTVLTITATTMTMVLIFVRSGSLEVMVFFKQICLLLIITIITTFVIPVTASTLAVLMVAVAITSAFIHTNTRSRLAFALFIFVSVNLIVGALINQHIPEQWIARVQLAFNINAGIEGYYDASEWLSFVITLPVAMIISWLAYRYSTTLPLVKP